MTHRLALIHPLERLGGIATLGTLYQEVFKITQCTWKTKTPFVPNQDKNKHFDERTLGQIRSLNSTPEYSFSDIVQRSSTIDVIWFNQCILSPLFPVFTQFKTFLCYCFKSAN